MDLINLDLSRICLKRRRIIGNRKRNNLSERRRFRRRKLFRKRRKKDPQVRLLKLPKFGMSRINQLLN